MHQTLCHLDPGAAVVQVWLVSRLQPAVRNMTFYTAIGSPKTPCTISSGNMNCRIGMWLSVTFLPSRVRYLHRVKSILYYVANTCV